MPREIDLLVDEVRRGLLVVEKESNRVWESEEMSDALAAGLFGDEDAIVPVDEHEAVTSPFPGCLQLAGGDEESEYRAVGQTRHFVLFAR